jgi:thiol:disulfide interchange protein
VTLRRALVGFVAAGCLFLLLEVVPSHREVVREKLVAAVPTIVSVLGLLAFAVAFWAWNATTRRIVQVVSVLLLLAGILGVYFHNAERLGVGREHEERETEEHERSEEHHAPPFAPLSLTGMGVLGLMATYPKWKPETEEG